jgi:hypothetical protein
METEPICLSELAKLQDISTIKDSNLILYSEDLSNNVWKNFRGVKSLSSTLISDPFSQSFVKSLSGCSSIYQDTYFNNKNSTDQFIFSFYVHNSGLSTDITPTIWFLDENLKPIPDLVASVTFNPKNGNFNKIDDRNKMKIDYYKSINVGNGWHKYFLAVTQFSDVKTYVRCEIFFNSTRLEDSPWSNNLILWGCQLQKGHFSPNYKKTTSIPIPNILDEGFVNYKRIEPSLGLPYITNLIFPSSQYNLSYWNKAQSTVQKTTNIYSPISTFDVFKIIPNTTNNRHWIETGTVLPVLNIPYTYSLYLKKDTTDPTAYRYAAVRITQMASDDIYLEVGVDLNNGNSIGYYGHNVTLSSYSITPSFSGWYRLNITGIFPNISALRMRIFSGQFASTDFTFIGNNSNHIYAWGAQVEKGTVASNLIPTVSSIKSNVIYDKIIGSSTETLSSYYFLGVAAPETKEYKNSKRFTGNDTFFLTNNQIVYNCNNPKYDFDINGDFYSLSAYFNTLSTNYFLGSSLNFNLFENVNFESDANGTQKWIMNYLSADKVFVTSLCSLSTVVIDISVPSICANDVFSSINWNVTAGGYLSAHNITTRDKLITPFITSRNSFFINLSCHNFTVNNRLCCSSISATNVHGFIDIDSRYFYYNDENLLTTRLSATYFLGVKPSDSYSSDNINLYRTLSGSWDGQNGSIIESYPVLKPYFKNIRQALQYVEKQGLYGEELNIMIYEDIVQNNVNTDDTFSESGCDYSGNINVRYYDDDTVPVFLKNAGLGAGDYIWNKNNNSETTGKISYWGVDRLDFSNLHFYGMYDIGPQINFDNKKYFTDKKPFNVSPRKISFNTYVCTNTALPLGSFGSNSNDWKSLYYKKDAILSYRPIYFNNDEMDVNIHNLCFEFNTNSNDASCMYFKSGKTYLSNVTIAALNNANYTYGAILAWPNSTVYVCGENQIDPYLLSPSRWNQWTLLPTATDQNYYPGYGLAIVGNSTNNFSPTFFSDAFIQAWRSRIFFMDFQVNRRIGRFAYHNASIILDGKFSANSFYSFKDHAKIYGNNYVFRANTFGLSNLKCSFFELNDYPYVNSFYVENKDNFYYLNFQESNSTFIPNYFAMVEWVFDDANFVTQVPAKNETIFTEKLVVNQNPKYIFDEDTKTVNISSMVFGNFQKNSLQAAYPITDNLKLYDYIIPSDLPRFNLNGLYRIDSPITTNETYTLNFY